MLMAQNIWACHPSSLKTPLWGNYPVFQDFSPWLVDGAILWVFPESIVVFLDPPVLLGITLTALSLVIAFGIEVPTCCGLLISTPVFLQATKSLRLSGAPEEESLNLDHHPFSGWSHTTPHHCRLMPLRSAFIPIQDQNDHLKTQIFFHHPFSQSF